VIMSRAMRPSRSITKDHSTDDKEAFMSALTVEHFVLKTAASATVSEAAARTTELRRPASFMVTR
jgi:hypothetical protein